MNEYDCDQAVSTAIMCSESVLGSDFRRGNEIGVATVERKDRTFTKLTENETEFECHRRC